MAPEQALGERKIDARVDVFALGCVMFECLAGEPAFAGENMMVVLAKVVLESPPRVGRFVPGLADDIEDLVERLLAKRRDARPSNAAEVVQGSPPSEARCLRAGPRRANTGRR